MSSSVRTRRPLGLAVLLLVTGAIGLIAAFALTIDRFAILSDPGADLGCDFSVIVQCGANLRSAQGAVLGFPNPLVGLVGYPAVVVVGVGILAGARFARWFWALFTLGVTAAIGFVGWLVYQSIFVIGTLCPWCILVWAATIPLFLAVLLHAVRSGVVPLPDAARKRIGAAYAWVPFITLICYILIAVVAQVRLDVLASL